jgi:heme A synthase
VAATRPSGSWERYAWAAGIVFVLALVAESVISVPLGANQNDTAAKIAAALADHRKRLLVVAYLSVVYAAAFVLYLWRLYTFLRGEPGRPRILATLVLVGGVLFVALHGVSDIGILGMLGGKVASYSAHHDPGISYTLYLLTFALDSVGDVFGSLFLGAAGLLAIRSGVLPRWLGWAAILAGVLFFLQGFGLGGVIATFGLVLDLIGFLLFLIFVLVSSVVLLRRDPAPQAG